MLNRDLLTDPTFIDACFAAGIQPTPRQAGKFRRGKGFAFRFRNFLSRVGTPLKDFADLPEEEQSLFRQRARVDFSHS